MAEYAVAKTYLIRGIEVTSEVTKDEPFAQENRRSLFLRSSCASTRWGTRSQDYSYTCPLTWDLFEASFEDIRRQAAETLARTELGEIPEGGGVPLMVVEIIGPTGQRMTPACGIDLSFSATLLGPEFIQMLELRPDGNYFCEVSNGELKHVPLYRGKIRFGEYEAETTFLPATYNGPVILGGDFFQKALRGKERLIGELIMPDHFRTLMNAARCKKKYVLIVGKYGDKRNRLQIIKAALADKGLIGLILDEYPDIEEQSLTEKMVTYATICRFVIADDVAPSGHIKELDICHDLKFVTVVLRERGIPATAMQADIGDEVSYIKEFKYELESELIQVVHDAADWADKTVAERANSLNRKYSTWRSPERLMR